MAALQCDICGGRLMGRAGGIFECDSCGMQYDTAWAKEKIQEIKGTVKVEGTVQIAGTVKVAGGVSVENYVKRANMALEDKKWDEAKDYFEQALNCDAECAAAYLGKFLIMKKCTNLEELAEHHFRIDTENINFQRALKYADSSLTSKIYATLEQQKINIAKRVEEAKEAAEQKRITQKRLQKIRDRIAPAQKLISARGHTTVCVKVDGTVFATGENKHRQCEVSSWNNVVQIANSDSHTVGLREDGTLYATGRNTEKQCNVSAISNESDPLIMQLLSSNNWKDIVDVSADVGRTIAVRRDGSCVLMGIPIKSEADCMMIGFNIGGNNRSISSAPFHLAALKKDGTVYAYGENDVGQCNVRGSSWRDIVSVETDMNNTIGLRTDGTIVMTEKDNRFIGEALLWKDIVAISVGMNAIVGLKDDGTVIKAGMVDRCDVSMWTDIVAVSLGYQHVIGLRADGTLLATGNNTHGECNVSGIRLFNSIDTYEEERIAIKEEVQRKADEERF